MIQLTAEEIISRVDKRFMTEVMINEIRTAEKLTVYPMDEQQIALFNEFNKEFRGLNNYNPTVYKFYTGYDIHGKTSGWILRLEKDNLTIVHGKGWDSVVILEDISNTQNIRFKSWHILNDHELIEIRKTFKK